MCGIAGAVNYPDLKNKHGIMQHRGPDSYGIWEDGDVCLIHRRLAILDLSEAGHQPMEFEDLVITFNGEVYNYIEIRKELIAVGYQFNSETDTEVILKAFHHWGKESVKKLNGMFAFCIYNRVTKKIFIARDHAGIKPLYYGLQNDVFVFGSELKIFPAFMKGEKDEAALIKFLILSYIPAPDSAYRNIKKLEPGCTLELEDGRINIENFWRYSDASTHLERYKIETYEDAVKSTEQKLSESVQRQMIADVPIGSFLSGGVDSSLITALAQQHSSKPIKTFAMGFPVKDLDESPYAADVAKHLKTEHTTLMFTHNELMDLLPDYDFYFDEPFGDTASLPLSILCKKAKEAGISVALSGDGGDEFFLGYERYEFAPKYSKLFSKNPQIFRGILSSAMNISGFDKAKKMAAAVRNPSVLSFYQILSTCIKPWDISQAVSKDVLEKEYGKKELNILDIWQLPNVNSHTASDLAKIDILYNLPDDMLVKADRASMRFSLEMRVPIIDREIMELSAAIPEHLHLKNGKKSILKDILYKHVPRELIERPKRGFTVPVAHWFRNELKGELEDLTVGLPYFINKNFVNRLVKEHLKGHNHSYTLWNIMRLKKFMSN
ncbi:asparagine synthase (glutamine-hydrolyzing) [Chryseobacterium wangxinyae]|uniref:asparagine synthase (glutamine-hydrolyzing) n=1 Tax=Chryseobacterium sp. CY353 TaxID=2997334 RepID=UPI00226FCE38|nr:asparagine synthase (glutamine-hydrolyzing) [Chryseobacterium sp. CY353]MCY0970990.1 asparagine synthase (glutamine-hydrolyzing) [Chryseobacterium sp. CY353]